MAITRLSGGTTPANGSDPRTFPAIWNAAADDIEAAEAAITAIEANDFVTTARIDDGAVTAPKLATTAGAVMVFADSAARGSAIPTPSEGMVTYLKDTNAVEKYDGSNFVNVNTDSGKILQVLQTRKSDAFSASVTNGATVAVTGLSATITPSSTSSKVLILVDLAGASTAGSMFAIIIKRNGTPIGLGDTVGSRTSVTSGGPANTTASGLSGAGSVLVDSPSSVEALTYSVDIHNNDNATQTLFVNRTQDDLNASRTPRSSSTITLMEVAG